MVSAAEYLRGMFCRSLEFSPRVLLLFPTLSHKLCLPWSTLTKPCVFSFEVPPGLTFLPVPVVQLEALRAGCLGSQAVVGLTSATSRHSEITVPFCCLIASVLIPTVSCILSDCWVFKTGEWISPCCFILSRNEICCFSLIAKTEVWTLTFCYVFKYILIGHLS